MKKHNIVSMLSKPFAGSRQQGATSLEYLMLGGVIVLILGAVMLADTEISNTIIGMFEGLLGKADPNP